MLRDTVNRYLMLSGTINWFDPVKGFGFIVSDEIKMDILLHTNVLRNFGQSSIADGVEVKVIAHRSDRGTQASEVLSVASPSLFNTFGYGEMDALDDVALSEIELQPGRIKWFDKAKGFGFANVFGKSDDIFVHIDIDVLRRCGLSGLVAGEGVALRVVEGKRGLMDVAILSWEAAQVK